MPSRADLRIAIERGLRGVLIAALAGLLWQSLHKQSSTADREVRSSTLNGMLASWSRAAVAPRRIHVQLDSVPGPLERDWLKALAAAGSSVTWSGDLTPLMIAAQPITSPTGGLRVSIAAPAGSVLELRDEVGVIDTVTAKSSGASLVTSSAARQLTARAGHSSATAIPKDSVTLHKLLVIANADWESKFVIAALEEDGWKVDAFVRVAPGVDVTQGAAAGIDTSRYSAVVALDNAVASYAARLNEFVRSGGGVVVAPAAAAVDALAPLRSGVIGRVLTEGPVNLNAAPVTLASLPFAPLNGLRADAVPLDRRSGVITVAATRVGAGRSVQIGYEDTWRWRMAGGLNSVRDHRAWWTGLVSSVAYAPHTSIAGRAVTPDDAPVAELVAALGPRAVDATVANRAVDRSHWMVWLFIILSLALLLEVASRRLRGAA
jgi:hypothetical protein